MTRLKKFLGACVVASSTLMAHASDGQCAPYLGQTVTPGTLEDLLVDLQKLPSIKDEFETTAAFDARIAAASTGTSGQRIVWVPLDKKYVGYDADTSKLSLQTYALTNENTKYSGVFGYGTPLVDKVRFDSGLGSNINIVVHKPETTSGTFVGQNSFGASTTITRVKRHTLALFEREGAMGEDLFFPNRQTGTALKQIFAEFPDTPVEVAKKVKTELMAAVIIVPKWPFYAKGKVSYGRPSIARPTDIDETLEVGIVDFQCALLTNSVGKVFGAIDTR